MCSACRGDPSRWIAWMLGGLRGDLVLPAGMPVEPVDDEDAVLVVALRALRAIQSHHAPVGSLVDGVAPLGMG
jgi:hypothetical protein